METDQRRSAALLFAVSALMLAFEIAQIRVFSYTIDAYVVYGAIAMAMLGLGASAVLVSLRPELADDRGLERLPSYIVGMGASMVTTMAIYARFSPKIDATSLAGIALSAVPLLLLCAVPYLFGGLASTILLTRAAGSPHVLYVGNLLGSALGCFALYPFMRSVGIERLLGVISALTVLVGMVAWRALGKAGPRGMGLAALVLAATPLSLPEGTFPFEPDPRDLYATGEKWAQGKGYRPVKEALPGKVAKREMAEWDPVSRVEVFTFPQDLGQLNNKVPLKLMTHDGGAGSLLFGVGEQQELSEALFEATTYGAAYAAVPRPKNALIIGLGGAPDVMAAQHHRASQITAVEVNGSVIRAARVVFDELLGQPLAAKKNVNVLHLDGRSFVEGTGETFDLIELSGSDAYSAGGAGAFVFSESYLYTVEAIKKYIGALRPEGALTIIRFGPEPLRLMLTEIEAARSFGITDASKHFIVFGQGTCQGVVFTRTALTPEQIDRAKAMVEKAKRLPQLDAPLNQALGLGTTGRLPRLELNYYPGIAAPNPIKAMLDAAREKREMAHVASLNMPFDVTPVTDDRPFFFQFVRASQLGAVLAPGGPDDPFSRGMRGHLLLLLTLSFASATALLSPLGLRRGALPPPGEVLPALGFFGAVGAAFMLIEVTLMQRTALFLGHPTYSISVTLFSLLCGSAAGSHLAGRMRREPAQLARIAAAAVVVLGFVYLVALLPIFRATSSLPLIGRGAVLFVALLPFGAPMGVFLPAGLRAISSRGPSLVAWALAANAIASVLASLLAAPLAMFVGFSVVQLVAFVLYGLAALFASRMGRAEAASEPLDVRG